MAFIITTATKKVASLKKRIRALPGGTSAGKTIAVLEVLIDKCQRDLSPTLTSIVSESVPHLKRGAMRDFKNIMQSQHYWKEDRWNATDSTYTFETGSQIEFFSVDNPDKLRGARRDRLFVNEANNVPFDAFEQLEVRTKEFVFLDWNPTNEFWYYTGIRGKRDDVEECTLTYKDNEGLDPQIIRSIEQRRNRHGWWLVYGLGQLGEVEGKIYKNWVIIDEVPPDAKLKRRGLDYGYSNDPSALVDVYQWNKGYVIDELLYQKEMSNKSIADIIISQEEQNVILVADSAEPKSNAELALYGIPVIAASKGKGSVNHGIQFIQDQTIYVTKRSINVLKEYRNYMWESDDAGKILNIPIDTLNHAMDAIRYAMSSLDPTAKEQEIEQYVQPPYEPPTINQ